MCECVVEMLDVGGVLCVVVILICLTCAELLCGGCV